jgi:iron complex outermembrane receptor protein
LKQLELIDGFGAFARGELELQGHLFASAALRYDNVNFELRDRFINSTNADDSGERSMSAISPLLGLVWRVRPLVSVYANYSTAFETPTITELTNQPDGSAGLNGVIDPQRTRTFEAGMQSYLFNAMQVDVSAFSAGVQDELLSFDVPNAPGRRAFRNAGRTRREGLEANVRVKRSWIEGGTAYTWSYFRFDDYSVGTTSFAGKRIPGIPENQLQIFATVKHSGLFGTLETIGASRVSANDAGTVTAPSYFVWNARLGYNGTLTRDFGLSPMIGVDNIFDRRYAPSIVTNATRGRFYEPGAERRVYAGLSIEAR